MRLKDFLGNEYGPGDLVVYGAMSGRSVNVVLGRVVDIYRVYYDIDKFRWVKLADDAPVPRRTNWEGTDIGECDSGTRVKVQPLRAARWTQHHGRKRYIDTRTGKGINPDAPSRKHILKESHFVFADGREYDYEDEQAKWEASQLGRYRTTTFDREFRKKYHINYGDPGQPHRFPLHDTEAAKEQLWYVSRAYQPWVQEVSNGPEPVTLEITDNIVKWEGVLPDGEAGA